RLDGVTKRFEDVVAVDDLSLDVETGSFFALLGPSGCGKTTTLRMIGGFEQPTEGRIYLGEREVSGLPAYKRDVNTVFQSYALFPHLSVFENVAFGLRRRAVRGETLSGRVREMLRIVGLEGMEKRKPRQLSGGQPRGLEPDRRDGQRHRHGASPARAGGARSTGGARGPHRAGRSRDPPGEDRARGRTSERARGHHRRTGLRRRRDAVHRRHRV